MAGVDMALDGKYACNNVEWRLFGTLSAGFPNDFSAKWGRGRDQWRIRLRLDVWL